MTRNLCPYAGKCGGCRDIGLSYEQTLRKKQSRIQSLLSDFAPVQKIIGMEDPLHYRCKVHHVFAGDTRTRIYSGFYRANSHYVVDIDRCAIENEKAQSIIQTIKKLAISFRLPIYNEDRGSGILRHVMVRAGYATGEIMVILVLACPGFPGKKEFVRTLLEHHPEITTVIANVNPDHTTMVLGRQNIVLYGPGFIYDRLCGLTFRLSPGAFYQVNPAQTEHLYAAAVRAAALTGREHVIDAYCGTGTIGLAAAAAGAGQVTGIELNPDAVRDARANAALNHISNVRFIRGDAGRILETMAAEGEKADVVFMDPPRTGSTTQFLNAVHRLSPERIVYISCGPESLKRDLEYLSGRGYTVQSIQPFDMFPFTEHVETVVLLTRH